MRNDHSELIIQIDMTVITQTNYDTPLGFFLQLV